VAAGQTEEVVVRSIDMEEDSVDKEA
jgi:hypothetical protein